MIDMSPEAVTARLRTMDDLWLLSVKLMNSKKVTGSDVEIVSNSQNSVEALGENEVRLTSNLVHEAYPKGK